MSYDRKGYIADNIRYGKGKEDRALKFINAYLENEEDSSHTIHEMNDFEDFCSEEIGSYTDVIEATKYNGFSTDDYYFRYDGSEFYSADDPIDLVDDDDTWEEAVQWWIDNEGKGIFISLNIDKEEMDSLRNTFAEWCDDATVEDTMVFSDWEILTVEWDELEAQLPEKDEDEDEYK